MKAILFSDEGYALYNSDFNTHIPDDAIEISDELYAEICTNQDGKWELVGGEVVKAPVEVGVYVPQSVTRRQGRLALIDAGKLADVESAIAAITDPIEQMTAQVEYEADTWERGNVFLQAMWAQLGGTEHQLDDLFILASTK